MVGEGFGENWDRAVDFELWDLKRRRNIARGDDVFFWQAPNLGFRGWARAVTDASDGTPAPRPWIPEDKTEYTQRFYMKVFSTAFIPGKWGHFIGNTTITAGPNTAPIEVANPHDGQYLRSIFIPYPDLDGTSTSGEVDIQHLPPTTQVDLDELAPYLSGDDRRRVTAQLVAAREGQPAFRASLIAAYDGRCAVSGTSAIQVLEAAHIAPYLGPQSNVVTNGLLLRSDIHTLFDRKLLAVSSDMTIVIAPALETTEYMSLDGAKLRRPTQAQAHPNMAALALHRESCAWT